MASAQIKHLWAVSRARWERLTGWPHWRKVWVFGLVILSVALVGGAVWALINIPQWQANLIPELVPLRRFEVENEARRTLAQIVIGVFGLLALIVAWRRVRAADRQVELGREGQFTERFTRAIEQLGAVNDKGEPKLEIRLGGIYALERLARDSEKDHWTIMEVLTAYIRENAPWRETEAEPGEQEHEQEHEQEQAKQQEQQPTTPDPRIDIQAILTVLGRRERSEKRERGRRLDLNRTDLRSADLSKAHLEEAQLWEARLEEAALSGAHLEEANLTDAHLKGADLLYAHLEGAIFDGAHLEGADLEGARLEGADLRFARLEGADLEGARLEGAHLEGADLTDAKGLMQEQINQARGDEDTQLPERLQRPRHWK